MLDADEYLHLAVHSSRAGDVHASMTHLKMALQLNPANAQAHYLLGAIHSEIGMTTRGIADMRQALALEPALEMARFQLGVLLADQAASAEARTCFRQVEKSTDAALATFAKALLLLLDGDERAAAARMAEGLRVGNANAALSTLMQRWLERITQALDAKANDQTKAEGDGHSFLGAYVGSST